MQGTCKWFNSTKGFGFITSPEHDGNIFVHYSNIEMDGYKQLNEGDKVEFDIEETHKGPQAINLIVTEKAPQKEKVRS